MFMTSHGIAVSLVLLITTAACTQPSPAPAVEGQRGPMTDGPAASASKTLTIALEGEPGILVSGLSVSGGVSPTDFNDALQHRLVGYNDRGEPIPQIASELPSTANRSWVVNPDGTMRTSYRLRPGVTWHDGAPVTSHDFAFGWMVHRDPALPVSGPVANLVADVATPDDLTLVITWKSTYPFANALSQDDLGPLPTHILQTEYESDKERFPTLPYWKREFVGTGPYRVTHWEPGSHILAQAYDGFYGGRARINTIIFRFIEDGSTVVANLLAGTVDGSLEAIDFNQVMFVRDEYERAGQKPTLVLVPTHWRMVSVQFRPGVVRPAELLDVRTRRALIHAIDRRALAETMLPGAAMVADTFITPTDPRWEWVKDVTVPHEYDPRQFQRLVEEVGWRRAADGRVLDGAGRQVMVPLWTTAGAQNEAETNIIANYWREAGLAVDQTVIPVAQQRDRRLRASYPGVDTTSIPLRFENSIGRVSGGECPTAENNWVGNNRGCYQHPEMDRVVAGLRIAIEAQEQRRLYREIAQHHGEQLPVLSLYFNIHADIFRDGVTGIRASSHLVRAPWNIAEWELR